jgi:hypothetical protein
VLTLSSFLITLSFQSSKYSFLATKLNMRYSIVFLLPLLVAAAPMPAQPARPNNALADGINKNLAAGNQEVAAVQNLQSVEQNHGSAAQVSAGIQGIQGVLSTAVGDRTQNQAINNKAGRSNAAVTADLNKVATAQGNAQANIDMLNGGAGDAAILSSLKTTFEGGAATNANALSHVSLIIQKYRIIQSLHI